MQLSFNFAKDGALETSSNVIKHCLTCQASDLKPIFNDRKIKAKYLCPCCGSMYRAIFIRDRPLEVIGMLKIDGKEYLLEDISTDIFTKRIFFDSEKLVPMEM